MSSTERAPEPTMEEILASIRRIISDDEVTPGAQDAAPEGYAQPAATEDVEEGIADTQIIADIERVLSNASGPAEATEDEILDLTDPGASVEAESAPELVEELVVTEFVEEVVIEPVRDFAQAFPSASADLPEPAAPAAGVAAMEPASFETPPVAAPPEPKLTVTPPTEDPTAALERAIAALKAGDLAAFAREAESKYAPPPAGPAATSALPPVAAEPLPTAGPTLAEQFAAPEEPPDVLEEELVILSDPEPRPEPVERPEWSAPEVPSAPEAASNPWHSDDSTWAPRSAPPEFAPQLAPRTNGGSGHTTHDFGVSSPKSLEDSVKEMLRPMLRKWLDENMQRVLTQALREELEDPQAPRRES